MRLLAGGDLLAAAVLLGLGSVSAWLASSRAASALAFLVWGFAWPGYLAAALALFWYTRGVIRTPRPDRSSLPRILSFWAGVCLLFIVLQTGFLYFAEHMFFLHRVQHLVMHHLAPFLIALSWPGEALLRGMPHGLSAFIRRHILRLPATRAIVGILQRPLIAAILFAGLVFLWLWPPLHTRAMLNERLFAVMNWSMILDGLLFFFLLFDPRPSPAQGLGISGRIVLALSVQIPQIALGAIIASAGRDIYPWYELCGRAFAGVGPLADQQLGGLVILFGGGMMSGISALILLGRLWQAEKDSVAIPALGT